jgi:tRNA (guanosine-2'-O-)-methyltransferase
MTETGAVDRRLLASEQSGKSQRWPRTARRQERVRTVLSRRQPDLTVVLENIHDPHNVSAILRSCDAVGVLSAHAIYSVEAPPDGLFSRQTSASAAKWVEVKRHESVAACFDRLHADGFSILATALGPEAKSPYEWDLTQPVALVLGNEMRGVSPEALALADGAIEIPMMGMVQSLNVSVAGAVCLYEAYRQRAIEGAYARTKLEPEVLAALEQEWLRR